MGSKTLIIVNGIIILVYVMLNFGITEAAPQESVITHLPGYHGHFSSKHYSGYVGIGENKTKQLFYYFVESESNPTQDPVVLWLNGGPGCSSMIGFADEHGPFTFELSKIHGGLPKLHLNPYSWSKVSNIIYLDSPAGVGFSFSRNESNNSIDDLGTASDTHNFLLKWFEMFPEFVRNPFFIAGESYAGVYIPTLASEIMKGRDSGASPVINLKGYLIGNGVTNDHFEVEARYSYAHGMGLIPHDLYQGILHACHGNYTGIANPECRNKLHKFDSIIEGLNWYDILSPCYFLPDPKDSCIAFPCYSLDGTDNNSSGTNSVWIRNRPLSVKRNVFRDHETSSNSLPFSGNLTHLCEVDRIADRWLNNNNVRKAIHAAEEGVSGRWEDCTPLDQYKKDAGSMIKYHKRLTSLGLRVLIYSQAWIKSLNYKIIDDWRPWISNQQVAGFVQGYEKNLTLLIVKGAGHMVPSSKPGEALDFFSRWLTGKKI